MNTIALIGGRPQHIAFVNRVHRKHPVSLVVIEAKQWAGFKGFKNRLRSKCVLGGRASKSPRVPLKVRSKAEVATYDRAFGDDWLDLVPGVEVMWADSINDDAVRQRLTDARPDVLIDHGTAIVKPPVLETAPLALNLHWGLSPYYRGTNCTEWALLHHDPLNIGVTVHRLAQRIDAGDIVGQARAQITPDDTALSINMKLTALGTDIMIAALDELAAGEQLQFAPQDLSRGYLTLNRQWSGDLRRHVKQLIASGGIARMLDRPARREALPIVELKR